MADPILNTAVVPVYELERIRDRLHAMSHQAPTNWCDVAASLQADVQNLIDSHRVTTLSNVIPLGPALSSEEHTHE